MSYRVVGQMMVGQMMVGQMMVGQMMVGQMIVRPSELHHIRVQVPVSCNFHVFTKYTGKNTKI